MKSKLLFIVVSVVVFIGIVFALRFIIGGNEDTWICVDGKWIAHGNPQGDPPQMKCGKE